jgi:capsular polysaccharide transport system permease protein
MQLHVEAERIREKDIPEIRPHPAFPPRPRVAEQPAPPAALPDDEIARPSLIRRLLRRPLFVALVLIPNLLSILYFGLIASPVYTSSASLIVLNPKQNGPSLSSLLSGASGDSSEQGGYILKKYFASWEAFRKVEQPQQLAAHFRQGDLVSRYGGLTGLFRANDVTLWRYFQKRVDVTIDQKSGIVSLDVDAYDPAYAVTLARALLGDAIHHMDAMNAQQERDYVRSAIARKTAVEQALRSDLAALASYRSRTGTYDPKELYLSNLSLMNSLAMKETDLKSQRDAIRRSTPGNPQADTLDTAMASVRGDIATTRQGFPSIARTSSEYEKLLVSRDNNITLLGQANLALHEAQASAEKNRYYLNVISDPSEPGTPESPKRFLWIGGVLLVSLLFWGLLR